MSKNKHKRPALVCSEIGLVRCLGAAGIPVITGSEEAGSPAMYSRYSCRKMTFSSYDSDRFVEELCAFQEGMDFKPVLMSYDDRLILNISRNRDVLLKHYRFLLPEKERVEKLLDKMKFIELSEDFDLPVPASIKVSAPADLEQVESRLKKPYLIKPLYRHHWFHQDFSKIVGSYKKAFVCSSRQELEDLYGRIAQIDPRVVVQEYVEGPDHHMYDINMYIDAEGDVKGSIVAQKLRVYPPTAGYGSYVVTVNDEKILNLCKDIASRLDLAGLVNIQFKRDVNDGKLKLIEIHPRTSIFDVLGIKAAMNLPAIYYADMSGVPLVSNGRYKEGVKYLNIERDLRLFLKNRKSYGLTIGGMARSYLGPKIISGHSLKDPLPSIVDAWHKVRRFF